MTERLFKWSFMLCLSGYCLLSARAATPAETFYTRLSCVAFDTTMRTQVVGDGRVEATLDGRMLTVSGNFEGLSAPATAAHLFAGVLVGVPGKPLFALTVPTAAAGTISGTFKLSADLAASLRGEKFYVQIDTDQAPQGAIWGWLMPAHVIPPQDVPEKGPWFLQ